MIETENVLQQINQRLDGLEVQVKNIKTDLEDPVKDLKTDLESQMVDLKSDLEGQMNELKISQLDLKDGQQQILKVIS
ncbi:hypothetical protein M670_04581 [Schinkia azotoformans MEV2011]|uniref:Uncharacterized protein n=1 Tax=Schinkia azotoformans MEV2011 TaxID=1348973 RepID=A0A072NSK7_SCHAZ|nr:hypothetical protein [Schinkia azotoformans]KEF36200.1 hypothetical protein M670_04581 [Schinkia azotoformans MEV2011]MEC1693877.1 hypothetical protein [Schinkia azotoformans]MEC1714688.1 hypothetical protein [Schinkia azotoformans]MEC1724778.1 hypothetical protein [Schinkia azotoformans]MEC1741137.1 hypothetical protein [Schinkia azotoformans]